MYSWDNSLKRLQELQKKAPERIQIELTYEDDSSEELSSEEVQERDSNDWKFFRVVKGNKKNEIKQLLEWLCPDAVF